MATAIVRGSDYTLAFTLTDSTGEAVDIATLQDVQICAYQKRDSILQSWSLVDETVTIVDSDAGQVSVAFDRNNTKGSSVKRVFVEIALVQTDTDFAEDLKYTVATDIVLGDVVESAAQQ